jgi:LysR family transcriptional regulator, cyn operon transcriptional activator
MEPLHLRYFIRAAELLHFTQAAESLYISQPALSTHIHQLEEEVGSQLFDRVGRNVRLTEAGKVFLDHARKAVHEIEIAGKKMTAIKDLAGGTLHIASTLAFGQDSLPSWIATFNAQHPKINIAVKSGHSDYVEEELQAGRADLGLSLLPPTTTDIDYHTLITEPVMAVVSKTHPIASRSNISLEDLCNYSLALIGRDWAARRLVDSVFASRKLSPDVTAEMDDLEALIDVTRRGTTATLLTRFAVFAQADLYFVPIVDPEIIINYGVLWHKQAELCPSAQAFLQHIQQNGR